jgi:Na+/melibiose symporter-like transporter
MKNLLLIFADMFLHKSGSYRWIARSIMSRIRLISMVLMFSTLGLVLINSALTMIISDLVKTTERQQQLGMTSISGIGLAIIICSSAAICLFFRKTVWGVSSLPPVSDSTTEPKRDVAFEISPLIQALSALVMEFAEERRKNRIRDFEDSEKNQA